MALTPEGLTAWLKPLIPLVCLVLAIIEVTTSGVERPFVLTFLAAMMGTPLVLPGSKKD
jgi:hypothetical protein